MDISLGAPEWALNIIKYLDTNEVHDDKYAKKIRNQAARYTIVDRILYQTGYSTPLLRCILFKEAQYMLEEIHKGTCGDYFGGKVLASKLMQPG